MATKSLRKKAKELYKQGDSVDQIVEKFMARPDVVQGLIALGIDEVNLRSLIEEEVK